MFASTATSRTLSIVLTASSLLACGGGGGGSGDSGNPGGPGPSPATYTVGGSVSGLAGSALILQNNGGNNLSVSANGAFSFTSPVATGSNYAVTVLTQPAGQTCTVSSGSGTMANAAISSISVACRAQVAKFIYAPDTGSGDVSAYAINPNSGMLTAVPGSPFAAAQSPWLITADPAGKFLYVANEGSTTPPQISVYAINTTTGGLTQNLLSPFDLSQPPPPNGTALLGKPIIHPSGKFGYLANSTDGRLYGATVDPTTGNLSPLTVVNVGSTLLGPAFFGNAGNFLYLPYSTPAGGIDEFEVDQSTGNLALVGQFPTGGNVSAFASLDPSGKFLVSANQYSSSFGTTGSVTVFAVNPTDGTLTTVTGSPFVTSGQASVVAFHPNKPFIYITLYSPTAPNTIAAYQMDSQGVLHSIPGSPFAAGGTKTGLPAIDPSGKFLFVANGGSNNIQGFAIDAATGALTPVPGSPFTTEVSPYPVVIDPSGKYLYAANNGSSSISAYSIDGTSGALTLINTVSAGTSPGLLELVGRQ